MQVQGFTLATSAPTPPMPHAKAWDGDGLGFDDLLDIVNPLQHLPIVGSLYRAGTDDEIGGVPRLLGGLLFGGLLGLAAAAVNFAIEALTGRDIGGHVTAALLGPSEPVLGREDRMLAWRPYQPAQAPAGITERRASDAYLRIGALVIRPATRPVPAYDA